MFFASYKLPEKCISFLDGENHSPVNAFRIIFGCLDDKKPEILKYKAFLMDAEYKNIIKIIDEEFFENSN